MEQVLSFWVIFLNVDCRVFFESLINHELLEDLIKYLMILWCICSERVWTWKECM